MLKLLITDTFAEWFAALDDQAAEDVATALDLIEQLGPDKAPPESRESLLWYEHPSVSRFLTSDPLASARAWDLEAWGSFHDYVKQVLASLDSPRFASRLSRLDPKQAAIALAAVKKIRRLTDPRLRWTRMAAGGPSRIGGNPRPEDARAKLRALYFEALEAAGFQLVDVPAHSRALRELSRRVPAPAFRLLYGVDAPHETALFVLGEWLNRNFYGDSVRRAERMWRAFLGGQMADVQPAPLR